MRTLVALWLTCTLSAPVCAFKAAETVKPPCSRQLAGQLWPEAANSDSALARILAQRGELEICTRSTWSYRWLSPTIRVNQLRKPR